KHPDYSVLWIPATSDESLNQAYIDVASRLGLSAAGEKEADVKKLVKDYLSKESAGQWLLIFDNADDLDMWTKKSDKEGEQQALSLIDYLPRSSKGRIVFTTRTRKVAVKLVKQNIVEVSEMDEETATQLLRKSLPKSTSFGLEHSEDISELLRELTSLPLAIVQAAAYINENSCTVSEYLALLREQEEDRIKLLSEHFEDD